MEIILLIKCFTKNNQLILRTMLMTITFQVIINIIIIIIKSLLTLKV